MKNQFLLFYLVCLVGCGDWRSDTSVPEFLLFPPLDKLAELQRLPRDTVLDYYDLSENLLRMQPDLSGYTIRSLNLSRNMLDTLDPSLLPRGLEKLNLSYNAFLVFNHDSIHRIKDLNLSHNFLRQFSQTYFIDRLDVSYNNLYWLRLYWTYDDFERDYKFRSDRERGKMSYLNMSHNPDLAHTVSFEPSKVDTIIRNDIADTKKLVEIHEYMRSGMVLKYIGVPRKE